MVFLILIFFYNKFLNGIFNPDLSAKRIDSDCELSKRTHIGGRCCKRLLWCSASFIVIPGTKRQKAHLEKGRNKPVHYVFHPNSEEKKGPFYLCEHPS